MSNNDIDGLDVEGGKENLEDEYGYEDEEGEEQNREGEQDDEEDEEQMMEDERQVAGEHSNGDENDEESGGDSDNGSGFQRKARTLRQGEDEDDDDDDDDEDSNEAGSAQISKTARNVSIGEVALGNGMKKNSSSDEDDDEMDDGIEDEEDASSAENEGDKQDIEAGDEQGQDAPRKIRFGGKRRKKNEFWKYRHKGKDGKWLPISTGLTIQHTSTTATDLLDTEEQKQKQQQEQQHQQLEEIKKWEQLNHRPMVESDGLMQLVIQRAMKFNGDILSQKEKIAEIVRLNEVSRQAQRATTELHVSSNEFEGAPFIAVTEDGRKYLTNVNSFCEKSVMEDFIKRNVIMENIDCLGDLMKSKKSALPKKKSIKKKVTKKNTFGADLYEQE